MSSTDAEVLKTYARIYSDDATKVYQELFRIVGKLDMLKDLAVSLGTDSPMIIPSLDLAIDYLGSVSSRVIETRTVVDSWAERL